MLKVVCLWVIVFLLSATALLSASEYLITPIWLANVVAAVYSIKLRRYLSNYLYIFLLSWSAVLVGSLVGDSHQQFIMQVLLAGISALQVVIFVFIYYWLIQHLQRFSYKRTVLLIVPNVISSFIAGLFFIMLPLEGILYLIFLDYFLEQLATGLALVCLLYGLTEYKNISKKDYGIMSIALVGQYMISINQLFHDCFILPLVNVYFTIHYHFKRFVFMMGLVSLICSMYLVLPLSGQYWKEEEVQLFSHLSTYRVGIASFILVFLLLSELQMRHRSLSRYLVKVSFYDELTNLKNRRFLREKILHSSVKQVRHGAVLLLDIDNFKKINDQYGHAAGDAVLQEMANILRKAVIGYETHLFRWGGEEFLILVENIESIELVKQLSAHIIEKTKSKAVYDEQEICFSVSMGVCLFEVFNQSNYHQKIDLADQMLYLAKHRGKARYVMAEEETA